MLPLADHFRRETGICAGQDGDRALTVTVDVDVGFSGRSIEISVDAVTGYTDMIQGIHDKGRVDVIADLADQCDFAVEFRDADSLIGTFTAYRSGGVQDFCSLSCLWKKIYIKGHIGIDTPNDNELLGTQ